MDTAPSVMVEKRLVQEQDRHQGQPGSPGSLNLSHAVDPDGGSSTSAIDDASRSAAHLLPPPYSGPSGSAHSAASSLNETPASRSAQTFPGLPRLDYKLYQPPLFDLSEDCTVLSSRAPHLSSQTAALVALIRAQSRVPPKPQVHIKGTRRSKVDFDIRLNLMSLLVPEDHQRRMDYIRCVSEGELAYRGGYKPDVIPEMGDGGLEGWCRRFVEDKAQVKSFCLQRVVANMDTTWLEGQLRSLVASTNYKGMVSVTFPVTHSRVVVQSPDKVNKFFTSVTTLFTGKAKYEVVQAVWPFATSRIGLEGRQCIVQSEEVWWREWRDPIRYAIATKRQGWVTNEDKLEAVMEGKGKGITSVDWGAEWE